MSTVEYEGRIILEKLENDEKPRDSYECSDWKNTLEENKLKRYIPENRLTQWIQQLTIWLKQLLTWENKWNNEKVEVCLVKKFNITILIFFTVL